MNDDGLAAASFRTGGSIGSSGASSAVGCFELAPQASNAMLRSSASSGKVRVGMGVGSHVGVRYSSRSPERGVLSHAGRWRR